MKPLKATEISYIIEAQIRGVSVSEVLSKSSPELVIDKSEKDVETLKVAPKKLAKKVKE